MRPTIKAVLRQKKFDLRRFSYHSTAYLCQESGGDDQKSPDVVTRGEQAKGAMRDYIKNVNVGGGSEGLWAKLRSTVAPPPAAKNPTKADGQALAQDDARSSQSSARYSNRGNDRNNRFSSPSGRDSPSANVSDANIDEVSESGTDLPQRSPNRGLHRAIPNKRFQAKDKRQGSNGEPSSGGPVGGKGSRRGNRDNEKDLRVELTRARTIDDIPDADKPFLFDSKYVDEAIMKGSATIDMKNMDELDRLLAEAYVEAFKTSNHTFRKVIEPKNSRARAKANLPKARSMVALFRAMQPQISTAPPGSSGYKLACEVWPIIQKNVYFTDEQKYRLLNSFGRLGEQFEAFRREQESQPVEEDVTDQPWFRKGLKGIEIEEKLKMLQGMKITSEENYEQGETDWGVQAVEDEDQL